MIDESIDITKTYSHYEYTQHANSCALSFGNWLLNNYVPRHETNQWIIIHRLSNENVKDFPRFGSTDYLYNFYKEKYQ